MSMGDRLMAEGRTEEAAKHYREAAEAEADAYNLVPAERPRTRGITAISVVNLFRRAGDAVEAGRRAHAYLAERDLPDWARGDLEDLLSDIRTDVAARE